MKTQFQIGCLLVFAGCSYHAKVISSSVERTQDFEPDISYPVNSENH